MSANRLPDKAFTPADPADNHKSYDVCQPLDFGFRAITAPLQKSAAQLKLARTEFPKILNRPAALRPRE